ncbi:MAG: chemotaxis protein [Gammaproteobacteria bacterium]|nr:chemotaxis protein [Gammaproteobacteria bacterium]
MKLTESAAAGSFTRRGGVRQLILVLLVISLAATVGTYYRAGVLSEYDNKYSTIIGQQQVLSQQVAKHVLGAADGKPEAFAELQRARDAFMRNMHVLTSGDTANDLPSMPVELAGDLGRLEDVWEKAEGNATLIHDVMKPITSLFDSVRAFDAFAEDMLLKIDELVNIMVESGASSEQIYITARQLMLQERIANNIGRTLKGGEGAVTAADRFGRDTLLFSQVIEGLLKGSRKLGIKAVSNAESRGILANIGEVAEVQRDLVNAILENSIELFRIQDAAATVLISSDTVLEELEALQQAYDESTEGRLFSPVWGLVFAALTLILLIVTGVQMTRDAGMAAKEARMRAEEARTRAEESKVREEETMESNRRNQEAILRLLGEISDLADGDLTVNATVTEDFTGAIADAINYSVEEMRGLVSNINRTSAQVATAAQSTRNTAVELSEESEKQAEQILDATKSINEIANAFEGVSTSAVESTEVAEQSVRIATKGAAAVRDTIAGMDTIRETIQETSKRIKRLGESSQEIGDIVGLIDDIADQTNILALNAAIQASMAGEAGRGFAVVADEVQRLAERSSQATHQIDELVKTIQSDTTDAVISMEKSTAGVVEGAQIAEGAGESLQEIEGVSTKLATMIEVISGDSEKQAGLAKSLSVSMNDIRDITIKTTTGTSQTAISIDKLADLASKMRESVSDFTIPEDDMGVADESRSGVGAVEDEFRDNRGNPVAVQRT